MICLSLWVVYLRLVRFFQASEVPLRPVVAFLRRVGVCLRLVMFCPVLVVVFMRLVVVCLMPVGVLTILNVFCQRFGLLLPKDSYNFL